MINRTRIWVLFFLIALSLAACDGAGIILGNFTWVDKNQNGIQDKGEGPLSDVTVRIYNKGEDTPFQTTRTDNEGKYSFPGLKSGEYFLEFVPPPAYEITEKDVRDNKEDEVDSDIFETGNLAGRTEDFELKGDNNDIWDAGFYMRPVPTVTPSPTPAPVVRATLGDGPGDVFDCINAVPLLDAWSFLDLGNTDFEIADDKLEIKVTFPGVDNLEDALQDQLMAGLFIWDEDPLGTPPILDQGLFGVGSHQIEFVWNGSGFEGGAWERMGSDFFQSEDPVQVTSQGNMVTIITPPGWIPSPTARVGIITEGLTGCDVSEFDFHSDPSSLVTTGAPTHMLDPQWAGNDFRVDSFFEIEFRIDEINDGRVCETGAPLDMDTPPIIDLTGFQAIDHPFSESGEFIFEFGEVDQVVGDIAGGVEMYYPGDPLLPFDPTWIYNNTGQNSVNFFIIGDGPPELSQHVIRGGRWTSHNGGGSVMVVDNEIHMHIPYVDMFPGPMGFESTTFIPYPTVTDFSYCDDVGLSNDLSDLDTLSSLEIFSDGFESGDTSAWSSSVP